MLLALLLAGALAHGRGARAALAELVERKCQAGRLQAKKGQGGVGCRQGRVRCGRRAYLRAAAFGGFPDGKEVLCLALRGARRLGNRGRALHALAHLRGGTW